MENHIPSRKGGFSFYYYTFDGTSEHPVFGTFKASALGPKEVDEHSSSYTTKPRCFVDFRCLVLQFEHL